MLITALGLSMDAFAAALARGAKYPESKAHHILKGGAVFGLTEGIMAFVGFLAAFAISDWITAVDHWVALFLLVLIGGYMIHEAIAPHDEATDAQSPSIWITVLTAIGTSIDSAAVGMALGMTGVSWMMAILIAATSFTMACIGMLLGPRVRVSIGRRAELVGGLILICIGISIFADHTLT